MGAMSDAAARVPLPGPLVDAKAIVLLSSCRLDDVIAPVEVLLQEGLSVISLSPTGPLTPTMLRTIFGRRVTVGVHDLRSVADAQWSVEQDAAFALTMGLPQAGAVLRAAGLPELPAALTPREVDAAWSTGAAGVQVVPANAFGNAYAAQLSALVPEPKLVVRGAEASHEVKAWLGAGAVAACFAEKLLGDSLRRGNLSSLRTRVRASLEVLRSSR